MKSFCSKSTYNNNEENRKLPLYSFFNYRYKTRQSLKLTREDRKLVCYMKLQICFCFRGCQKLTRNLNFPRSFDFGASKKWTPSGCQLFINHDSHVHSLLVVVFFPITLHTVFCCCCCCCCFFFFFKLLVWVLLRGSRSSAYFNVLFLGRREND